VEQRLQIDGVSQLGADLRVRVTAHHVTIAGSTSCMPDARAPRDVALPRHGRHIRKASAPDPMFRLRTLGELSITNDDVPVHSLHGQRKALAFLSVLAESPVGVSRDKMLALLWPESSADEARGSLKQLVFTIRRALGAESVRGVQDLQLNRSVVASDVEEFSAAASSGRGRDAFAAYRGDFLDAIHIRASVEFERWVDTERGRLRQTFLSALERLADEATRGERHEEAVSLRRRLCDEEPLSGRAA